MAKAVPKIVEKVIHGQTVQVIVYPTSNKNRPRQGEYPKMKKGPIRKSEVVGT